MLPPSSPSGPRWSFRCRCRRWRSRAMQPARGRYPSPLRGPDVCLPAERRSSAPVGAGLLALARCPPPRSQGLCSRWRRATTRSAIVRLDKMLFCVSKNSCVAQKLPTASATSSTSRRADERGSGRTRGPRPPRRPLAVGGSTRHSQAPSQRSSRRSTIGTPRCGAAPLEGQSRPRLPVGVGVEVRWDEARSGGDGGKGALTMVTMRQGRTGVSCRAPRARSILAEDGAIPRNPAGFPREQSMVVP